MTGPPPLPFGSLGNVTRAGKTLRRAKLLQEPMPTDEQVRQARKVVNSYRSAHDAPLRAANMGLRSCITTEGFHPEVTQRLKRLPTIEDKLARLTTMNLSSMQDIGGCRAVLITQEQVHRVLRRFRANSQRRNRQSDKTKDYVDTPRDSGYRAIHIHTSYHGRRIEVQLRTREQHRWAKLVEDLTRMTGVDFKNGDGPPEVHELLKELAVFLSIREPDQLPRDALVKDLTMLASDLVRRRRSVTLSSPKTQEAT